MKKKYFGLLFLLPMKLIAQSPLHDWAINLGGAGWDVNLSMNLDADNNVYTTGYFDGTADFDPGVNIFNLSSVGSTDIFISKLNSSGNFLWAKRIGGTGSDLGTSIYSDNNGNVYIAGLFQNTVDFNPGTGTFNLTSAGNYDAFICKLDSLGNFIWAKRFGGSDYDGINSIKVDSNQFVFSTGFFGGTADFNPGTPTYNLNSAGMSDIFISKLDVSGNFVWAKQMGGNNEEKASSLFLDANGNILTTGSFRGSGDYDPGSNNHILTSLGGDDIFISKIDGYGNFIWAIQMGGASEDIGYCISVDQNNNVYYAGHFGGTADFDPGINTFTLSSFGNSDIIVGKLDASGNFLWAKSAGASNQDRAWSIHVGDEGNVYTTGFFIGSVDFDPGVDTFNLISSGLADIFISKLDSLGNFIWAKRMGGTNDDFGLSIQLDEYENIFTSGYFWDTGDFDPGLSNDSLTSSGNIDVFVQKSTTCIPDIIIDTITACNYFTWIDGNTYTSNNTSAIYYALNSTGCDSIHILNLTIHTVDLGTNINGITISSNEIDGTFQWLDCNNSMLTILNETNQTFTPFTNGSYAVEVSNKNGCVDTSNCVLINSVGIVENLHSNSFFVYPNPNNGMFNLEIPFNGYVSITDLTGRIIYSAIYHSGRSEIQIKKFTPGVYFINISYNGKTVTTKIFLL